MFRQVAADLLPTGGERFFCLSRPIDAGRRSCSRGCWDLHRRWCWRSRARSSSCADRWRSAGGCESLDPSRVAEKAANGYSAALFILDLMRRCPAGWANRSTRSRRCAAIKSVDIRDIPAHGLLKFARPSFHGTEVDVRPRRARARHRRASPPYTAP